jgi:hypothetical protein
MANGAPPQQSRPNPFDELHDRLDALATRIGSLEAAIDDVRRSTGAVDTGIGDLKTTAGDVGAAVGTLKTSVDDVKAAADSAKTAADNAKTAAEKTNKGWFWPALLSGVTAAIIAGVASYWAAQTAAQATLGAAQKNFEAALAVAKTDLENAAKKAFETQRGTIALQDYQTGQNLIENIETEFEESAIQRSVKKELGANLHAFKLLADRLKVPALAELSDYAGPLLGAYARGDKLWEDYQKQDKQEMQQRGDKALKALGDWANNP